MTSLFSNKSVQGFLAQKKAPKVLANKGDDRHLLVHVGPLFQTAHLPSSK